MALSQGQLEAVLKKAGVDLGRATSYLGRNDLNGTQGQDALYKELTGGVGGFYAGEQQANQRAAQDALLAENEAKQADFLGRFSTEVPTAMQAVEQSLGLPNLRTAATRESQLLEDIPDIQTQAARGRDINANQLQRIIANDTQEQAPIAQRAISQAQEGERLAQNKYGQIIAPYEIEAGFLGENIRNAVDIFKTNLNADLERELANLQLQSKATINQSQLATAIKLAEMEQSVNNGQFVDLGDRIGLVNSSTGDVIQSFLKGLAPTSGDKDNGWP